MKKDLNIKERSKKFLKEHESAIKFGVGFVAGITTAAVGVIAFKKWYLTDGVESECIKTENNVAIILKRIDRFGRTHESGSVQWDDMTDVKEVASKLLEAAETSFKDMSNLSGWEPRHKD